MSCPTILWYYTLLLKGIPNSIFDDIYVKDMSSPDNEQYTKEVQFAKAFTTPEEAVEYAEKYSLFNFTVTRTSLFHLISIMDILLRGNEIIDAKRKATK